MTTDAFTFENAMYSYVYNINNVKVEFLSNIELINNKESSLFLSNLIKENNSTANGRWIRCNVNYVKNLPKLKGQIVSSVLDTTVYCDNENVTIEIKDRKSQKSMMQSVFPIGGGDVQLYCLEQMLPHTSRVYAFWSAIDLTYQMLLADIITVHSSVINQNGEAIIFMASSQVGKSTQARLWEEYRGAIVLNGDKACLTKRDGIAYAMGTPYCGTSEICTNFQIPLKAIVLLSQGKENTITTIRGIKAFLAILNNCFGHKKLPGCTDRLTRIIGDIIGQVPVYALSCTPDKRAVEVLEKELFHHTEGEE